MGAVEVEFEERLGGGELDDLAVLRRFGRGLVEAVVAAAAEFGEALLEGVGEVEGCGAGLATLADFFDGFLCGLGAGFGGGFLGGAASAAARA